MSISLIHLQKEAPKAMPHQWVKKKVGGIEFYSYLIYRTPMTADEAKAIFLIKKKGIFLIKKLPKTEKHPTSFHSHLANLKKGQSEWAKLMKSVIGEPSDKKLYLEIA